jgi:hypothetical protein
MGLAGRALFLSLACGAASSQSETQVAIMAEQAVSERCTDGFIGDFDAEDGREEMEATLGGNNFVLDILTEASSPEDAETRATEYLESDGVTLVGRKMFGFAMFVLMLVLFPCFCLTACPCCVRCRVCRPKDDPRNTNGILKLIGLCAVGGVGVGICICWGYALSGHALISDGVDNMGCTSAKLIHTALEGQEDPDAFFIGLDQMVTQFQALENIFDMDSDFMMELNVMIDDTQDIDTSIQLATETLSLLTDMMRQTNNANPGGFHTCVLCATLAEEVAPAASALGSSLGSALAQARSETKKQLSEANTEEMKRLLNQSIQPTIDAKESLSERAEPFVDAQNWDEVQVVVGTYGLGVVLALVALAAVLVAIGFLSMGCFLAREGDNVRGYNRTVHKSACCVWMVAWLLCLSCFLWGGFIEVLAVPLSSVCLILDDVNGDMIRDIRSTLDITLDPESSDFVMMTDVVDKCLNPVDPTQAANLADIFFITDDNGTRTTMREQLVGELEDKIMPKFDEVADIIAESAQSDLENDPVVVAIRSLLSTTGPDVDGWIVTDRAAIRGSGEAWAPSLPEAWPGYASLVRCGDYTEGVPGVEAGVESYVTAEDGANGATLNFPNDTCSGIGDGISVGSDCLSAVDADRCSADDFLLHKKHDVMTDPIFRCDVFETDSGDPCDIKDMLQSNPVLNIWSNDCIRADGTLRRREVSCTLQDFSDYLAGFDERIQNAMARVDATTAATATAIGVDMRALLEAQVISPIIAVIDGIQCNWLSEHYQETINGVCYQGVVGMNRIGTVYVAVGMLLVFLIMIMYALWRRAVDNVKLREAMLTSDGDPRCGSPATSGVEGSSRTAL